jgi:hypothetical protein
MVVKEIPLWFFNRCSAAKISITLKYLEKVGFTPLCIYVYYRKITYKMGFFPQNQSFFTSFSLEEVRIEQV